MQNQLHSEALQSDPMVVSSQEAACMRAGEDSRLVMSHGRRKAEMATINIKPTLLSLTRVATRMLQTSGTVKWQARMQGVKPGTPERSRTRVQELQVGTQRVQ